MSIPQAFHLNLQIITRKISRQSQQKWYVHFCLHHTDWTFLSELSDGFSHMGTVKFTQINTCIHMESVLEYACRHTQLRPASIETTVIHIPFIQGAMQQTHTPTCTASSPRPSVFPQVFLTYLAIFSELLQVPATPNLSWYLINPPKDHQTHRWVSVLPTALHGVWRNPSVLLSALLSPSHPPLLSVHQSQPFHGVSSVRSDMFSSHSSRWLPARPQAAVSSSSYYQVSFGVSVDVVTWLSTPGWILQEKMPISQRLP